MPRRLSLLVALWLAPAVAAQDPAPRLDPNLLRGLPGFPGGNPARPGEAPFDPAKMFEQLFGPGGAAADDEALSKIAISPAEEARLGEQALEQLKRQLATRRAKLLQTGREAEYLARLVELVRPQMTQARRYRKLQVYLADLDDPGAYSLPGGHIVFTRGLVDAAGCEAALVVVAGHELAHLDRGHLLRRVRQWKLAEKSLRPGADQPSPDKMFQSMNLMMQLFQRPFGPDEELEADGDGITWAWRLGYDPRAVRLIYEALEPRGPAAMLPAFLRTHPLSAERQQHLRETIAALSAAEPKADFYLGRENLARRLTRKQREFAE
jgi:predicted Zn-dependent protease